MTTLPGKNLEPVAIDPQLARYGRQCWQAVELPSRESNWWLVLVIVFLATTLVSCAITAQDQPQLIAATMPETTLRAENQNQANSLDTEVIALQKDATGIDKNVKTDRPFIVGFLQDLFMQIGGLAQVSLTVHQNEPQIEAIASQVTSLTETVAVRDKTIKANQTASDAEIARLNAVIASGDHKAWLLLELGCAICIGLGVACAIVGGAYFGSIARGIGTALGVASGVVGILGLVIPSLQNLMPYIIGVSAALILGFIVWVVIKKRAALIELIQTGEAAKQVMPTAQRLTVFGNGALPGAASTIQSAATETMVAAVRNSGTISTAPSVSSPAVAA